MPQPATKTLTIRMAPDTEAGLRRLQAALQFHEGRIVPLDQVLRFAIGSAATTLTAVGETAVGELPPGTGASVSLIRPAVGEPRRYRPRKKAVSTNE